MGLLEFEENIVVQDFIKNKDKDIKKILPILSKHIEILEPNDFNNFIDIVTENSSIIRILKRLFEYKDFSSEINDEKVKCFVIPINVSLKRISLQEGINKSNTVFEKLLVCLFYLTNLINLNGFQFLYCFDYFIFYNSFSFYPISISAKDKKTLLSFFKELNVNYLSTLKCLRYNILKKRINANAQNRKQMERFIKDGFIFNFTCPKIKIKTEEEYILNSMFKIRINEKGEIVPLSVFDGVSNPNINSWTSVILDNLSKFFSSSIIQHYLDAIEYLLAEDKRSNALDENCVIFFMSCLAKKKKDKWYECQGLVNFIISCPYTKKSKTFFKNNSYFLRKKTTPTNIKKLFLESKLPVPNNLEKGIIKHSRKAINELYSNINDFPHLSTLLNSEEIYDSLSISKYKKIKKAFYQLCKTQIGVEEAHLYLCFAKLLCSCAILKLSINCEKEKRMLVDSWKNIGLENCIKGMQEIKSEPMTFDKKQIDLFNEPIVADCRNFGYSSRFNSKQNLSELMSRASQHALIYLCNNILIENDFPVENSFSTKTPLGSIISEHLQKSIVGREYILMNNLDPKEFLFAYYESANSELQINISLFRKEKELFERLSKENKDLNLAKFNEIPCYADLCQLFPAIDSKILELGKKFNICPLKNDEGYIFSGRKEASTVLKSVIKCLVDKYDTLEVASDLICAYLILFDKKSLNIRNTTVHGNDYPFDQNRLCFNRKAALIALGIILDRIKTI